MTGHAGEWRSIPERYDQVAEIFGNQRPFMGDIDKMTAALTAIRSRQESNRDS
jgi:hypothetical protein